MTQFKVKSIHLDSARNFIPIEELYGRVQEFSLLGFTHLQLLLADDQGWRFESFKYPRLHQLGSIRDRQVLLTKESDIIDEVPYEGYYTQEQLKALVEYAKGYNMEIIPLIDIPGHSSAAIHAYPELASGPVFSKVPSLRGSVLYKSRSSTICYTSEFTKVWVKDIFEELIDVFGSEYIHLGFDEIAHGVCERCSNCTSDTLMDLLRLATDVVIDKGKKPIIWWRIEKSGLDISKFPELTLQWWGPSSLVANKVTVPNDIIFSQPQSLYFDYPEAVGTRLTISEDMGTTIVQPHNLSDKINKFPTNVIGISACLWSESLTTEELRDDFLYPRTVVLANILKGFPVGKLVSKMVSWQSSSYITQLIKLIRNSSLPLYSKNILKFNMDAMTMIEFLTFLDKNYSTIDFRSIPLSKIKTSTRSAVNKHNPGELEKIELLYGKRHK